jgi:type IV pilus assembly protein PilQ
MKGFIRLMIIGALVSTLLSCASQQTEEDDSLTAESYSGSDSAAASKDDFSDFDNEGASSSDSGSQASSSNNNANQDPDLALENEINQASGSDKNFAQDDLDGQAKNELQPQAPQEAPPVVEQPVAQEPPPPIVEESIAPTEEPPAPIVAQELPPTQEAPPPAAISMDRPVEITGLKYKANDSGGTVIVEANGAINYTTRVNADLKQYIVEIPNTILPKRLKRTLNTKDIKGAVGAVDAYQSPGSTTSRIVVQMRPGFGEPVVQQEGNSLLIVTSESGAEPMEVAAKGAAESEEGDASLTKGESESNVELSSNKILASQSLDEFLSGNTKFYGRKISIETSNIDVRDALKFITEESGVNMVITDEVKGNISLKLRQVPWDQALVVIMKARKLGYSRQGSVLRIVPLDDLKKEEDDATKLALARKNIEPLKVRAFNISYAKVDELDKKIKDFLTERGKVVSDIRTNTIVVTDIEDSINRVVKLIQGLDSAPPQVLIEGKIVEALDSFQRTVGVQWNFTGADVNIGSGANGPVNLRPNLAVGQAATTPGGLGFGLNVGVLDIFGDLTASLALFEKEEKVKVLSSPRIVTLSNEKADISQTNELPVKTLTPQAGGQPLVTYQFKPLTLKLEVTPQVTGEGTVIMKVAVNRQIKGAAVSSTDDTFSVNSREANTRVIVKNGQTAVIGGIYRSDVTEGTTGVPWLKDIPVLGALFRGTSTDKQRSELLIFLTPRILANAEGAGAHSGGE